MARNSSGGLRNVGPKEDGEVNRANGIITAYLEQTVPEFKRLNELRRQGWLSGGGDRYFQKQRNNADYCDERTARNFYEMMRKIAKDMQDSTDCLRIRQQPRRDPLILDCCMAPGGFLSFCLQINPGHAAVAFTLPPKLGGHEVLLPPSEDRRVSTRFLDITMLSADLGLRAIPSDHPDIDNSFSRQLLDGQLFDLVLCDGQVLRRHERASYREKREPRRLSLSQLVLGLQHISPGGTTVVLLHKLEAFQTANLVHMMSKFAKVQLFKSTTYHAKRSSFYLIAMDIQPTHPEAIMTLSNWRRLWQVTTTGSDEECVDEIRQSEVGVHSHLEEYGPELVRLGKEIWTIQAGALAKMSWTRKNNCQRS